MTAVDPPRYLVSFHPKEVSHRFCDVLVLGAGLAGFRSALAVDSAQSVLVVTKSSLQQSNSQWAQGGIAAVWNTQEDTFESHTDDTLIAGQGLCNEAVVEHVIHEAPKRVQELIDWGAHFDLSTDGQVALTREGGHRFSRILHALGDATGREIMRTVIARAAQFPNIRVIENTFTVDLLTHEGRCVGAITWSEGAGIQHIWAKETILATGGCGALYRETTNPNIATGDGLAIAFRAGAELQDMEFIQFHPTVLYVAGSARHLISEAVRGEGAYLRDCRGERFMPLYDSRAELAPRDIVAQSIVRQMEKTKHPCVYLDQRDLDPDRVRERFPGIAEACSKFGIDFARDLIPVRPGAHYMIGGATTDLRGATSLAGLWAAGEVAATGLHGANRLASNSLLEALVFGESAGRLASSSVMDKPASYQIIPVAHRRPARRAVDIDVADIRNSLQSLMFRQVGIERDAEGLDAAAQQVDFWSQYVQAMEFDHPAGWELQNMLTVAGVMILAAKERTESRGTHYRCDFPKQNETAWKCHLTSTRGQHQIKKVPLNAHPDA
jgi:L-aspartate oxidase